MSDTDEPVSEYPFRPKTGVITMIVNIFIVTCILAVLIPLIQNPSPARIASSILILLLVVFHFIVRKPATPPTFYITPTHIGFGNYQRGRPAVPFDTITRYHETPSGISIIHESISVPLGMDLHRHSFSVQHWDEISSTLLERVRQFAPNAEIVTLLDPPQQA